MSKYQREIKLVEISLNQVTLLIKYSQDKTRLLDEYQRLVARLNVLHNMNMGE
jgi:hypothetical protein